jgi:hypothetical protein
MTVKLGDRAIYYPRVPYGRQSELFCFVTRVADAEKGIVDLVTFPAAGEFQHINNVMPKGDGIQIHCWEPREEGGAAHDWTSTIEALQFEIHNLEFRLNFVSQELGMKNYIVTEKPAQEATAEAQATLQEAQAEVKRGPGRPRKDAA